MKSMCTSFGEECICISWMVISLNHLYKSVYIDFYIIIIYVMRHQTGTKTLNTIKQLHIIHASTLCLVGSDFIEIESKLFIRSFDEPYSPVHVNYLTK